MLIYYLWVGSRLEQDVRERLLTLCRRPGQSGTSALIQPIDRRTFLQQHVHDLRTLHDSCLDQRDQATLADTSGLGTTRQQQLDHVRIFCLYRL